MAKGPTIHWIDGMAPGRLGIMPCPRGGTALAGEIAALAQAGVDLLVSLLSPEEIVTLGLADEGRLCEASGIGFLELPIGDMGVPASEPEASALIATLAALLDEGKRVVLHCHGGIGRSGMIAAAVMIARGSDADAIFGLISEARGCPVPETRAQRAWALRRSTDRG